MRVATNDAASLAAIDDDTRLVELLRAGHEQTFVELIDRHHSVMLRLANVYVRDCASCTGRGTGHLAGNAAGPRSV